MSPRYDKLAPALKRLLPEPALGQLGRAVGFIRRLRTIQTSLFVLSVVMSRFGHGRPGFEAARQWYERLGGPSLGRRPLQLRFKSSSAVRLMEEVFELAVAHLGSNRRRIDHPLARKLPDIAVIDSTTARVDDSLRSVFKGTGRKWGGEGAALVKILLTISAFGGVPLHAILAPGALHDSQLFPPLEAFAKGTLLLFDKGFFSHNLLDRVSGAGLNFLCPMKRACNPRIVGAAQAPRRVRDALRARGEAHLPLRAVLARKGKVTSWWDLDVVFGKRVPARLIIKPGPDGVHRAYITTLSRDEWPMRSLPELYRLRWQVELVFKELKQDVNLERLPTKDRHAAQVFIWASLVALAVSRTVSAALYPSTDRLGLARRVRPALVTRALRSMASWLGTALTLPKRAAAAIFQTIETEIERGLAATRPGREDSFQRLIPLLSS